MSQVASARVRKLHQNSPFKGGLAPQKDYLNVAPETEKDSFREALKKNDAKALKWFQSWRGQVNQQLFPDVTFTAGLDGQPGSVLVEVAPCRLKDIENLTTAMREVVAAVQGSYPDATVTFSGGRAQFRMKVESTGVAKIITCDSEKTVMLSSLSPRFVALVFRQA